MFNVSIRDSSVCMTIPSKTGIKPIYALNTCLFCSPATSIAVLQKMDSCGPTILNHFDNVVYYLFLCWKTFYGSHCEQAAKGHDLRWHHGVIFVME